MKNEQKVYEELLASQYYKYTHSNTYAWMCTNVYQCEHCTHTHNRAHVNKEKLK